MKTLKDHHVQQAIEYINERRTRLMLRGASCAVFSICRVFIQ